MYQNLAQPTIEAAFGGGCRNFATTSGSW